ncbi:dynactin p62 family-domain-containing protein [Chaetomium sp. MPI-CAGE-AT-0009]|nr:dynactin p62 family-domain-containing protein [Chaetomium sp. MPI-CAGE-AT-0009]
MSIYTGGSLQDKKTRSRLADLDESAAIERLRSEGHDRTASAAQLLDQAHILGETPLHGRGRFTSELRPIPYLLRTKRPKRCPICRHIISKPQAKLQTTRFRIRLVEASFIPSIAVRPLLLSGGGSSASGPAVPGALLEPLKPAHYLLTFKNPIFGPIRLHMPLNTGNGEIRVLSLLPSPDRHDAIVCQFEIQSLNAVPSYNALSYCWGLEPEGPEVDIMGTKLKVKPNLFAALSHLRDKDKPVKIWVDALCINQRDATEREQQVSMMGQIYERAEIVYTWLGDEADDSAQAMVLLQILQKAIFEDKPGLLNILQNGHTFVPAWRALIPLFRRPYWTRVWIIQEVLLGKNVMLCCGSHRVAWPTFCVLVTDLLPRFGAEHAALSHGQEDDPISNAFHALEYLTYDVDKLSQLSLRYQELLDNEGEPRRGSSGGLLDLLDCLTMSRWRCATDERDHVHGILSLAAQARYINQTTEIRLKKCSDKSPCGTSTPAAPLTYSLDASTLPLGRGISTCTPSIYPLSYHPLWFEKSASYLESSYESLVHMVREAGVNLNPGRYGQEEGSSVRWSLKFLNGLLNEVRNLCRGSTDGKGRGLLGDRKEFELHLQRFLGCHREYCQRQQLNAKLPTWTPNWALPLLSPYRNLLLWSEESRDLYRAVGGTRPQVRYEQGNSAMMLSGVLVGHVAHVPRPAAQESEGDLIKAFWDYARVHSSAGQPGRPYGAFAKDIEAFRQLLSLGRTKLSLLTLQLAILEEVGHAGCQSGTSDVLSTPTTDSAMREEVLSVYKAWVGDVGRQFFITSSGHYGAGPTTVETGDLVVIPFGGKVPLILRPNGPVFYLVEECYVQGFMQGEFFTGQQDVPRIIASAAPGHAHPTDSLPIPSNARIADYVPTTPYCRTPTLLVKTGGYSSFQHAPRHGTPLVVAGVADEKPQTAARAQEAGVAVNLRMGSPSVEQLCRAVAAGNRGPGGGDKEYKARTGEVREVTRRHDLLHVGRM